MPNENPVEYGGNWIAAWIAQEEAEREFVKELISKFASGAPASQEPKEQKDE